MYIKLNCVMKKRFNLSTIINTNFNPDTFGPIIRNEFQCSAFYNQLPDTFNGNELHDLLYKIGEQEHQVRCFSLYYFYKMLDKKYIEKTNHWFRYIKLDVFDWMHSSLDNIFDNGSLNVNDSKSLLDMSKLIREDSQLLSELAWRVEDEETTYELFFYIYLLCDDKKIQDTLMNKLKKQYRFITSEFSFKELTELYRKKFFE